MAYTIFLFNLPNKLFYPYRFSNNCLMKYSSLTQYWSWKCISFRGFVPNFDMPNKLFFSLVCRLSNCLTIKNSYLVQWLNIGFVATAVKGGFFQKVRCVFQISKKMYSKKLSWTWNLKFKLRIVFWNIFFWRFGDLKNTSHFLKKSDLYAVQW